MTLEEKLKLLEQNEAELANRGWSLIQALRKAIEQRDWWIKTGSVVRFSSFKDEEDRQLLEILEGE